MPTLQSRTISTVTHSVTLSQIFFFPTKIVLEKKVQIKVNKSSNKENKVSKVLLYDDDAILGLL